MNGFQPLRRYTVAALALLLTILFVAGCVKTTSEPSIPTPILPTVTPAQPTPTPSAAPSPSQYPLTFTTPDSAVIEAFMTLPLNAPVETAIDLFGEPTAIYGQSGYIYQAIAGGKDSKTALVYRFLKDKVGLECIVASDGRILKKQVSTPGAFPKLLENVMVKFPQGIPDQADFLSVVSALGVTPYLWMSFLPPNATTDTDCYSICIWPDEAGQLAAVVQHNLVLRWEYQPHDTVLDAVAVDHTTPRVPRWLAPDPKNGNDKLSKYTAFVKFSALLPGQSEQQVIDKMGAPTQVEDGVALRTIKYAVPDAAYAGGNAVFVFQFGTGEDNGLISKSAQLMPIDTNEVRARYAMQMLPGMTRSEIARFMNGSALLTSVSVSTTGELLQSYSYAGSCAMVSAVFMKDTDVCLYNEIVVNDTQEEAATLYEEYVLPVFPAPNKTAAPKKTPTPAPQTPEPTPPPEKTPELETPIPTKTLPIVTRPPATPTPRISIWIPSVSLRPLFTPTPAPTPTPIIIK